MSDTDLPDIETEILALVDRDPRFAAEAYQFVIQSLEVTRRRLGREEHVSGPELLHGALDYATRRFGPLGAVVFRQWGVCSTRDFGHIVLNLAQAGILSTRSEDTIESFTDVFDFGDEFARAFARRRSG